ncbi:MAG: mercuric reductase [Acidobacteria bacterium]|nr:mercuric reductase [Acidobacteriota bacterium]
MTTTTSLIEPDDSFNRLLTANVHPADWRNPTPDGRYNLVVVGAGTAGLICASVAAGLGARVALVERHLMGGDCLNVGCVPSKGMIRAARVWASARDAAVFGLTFPGGVERDFGVAMERMRRLRSTISAVDSAERYRGLGVDVYLGDGQFTGPDALQVGDATLHFARAAICTGGRATAPPIPGLAEAGYLTNETIFSLTELPPRLAVIGAGPIGCEMAQAFARFGSDVTAFEQAGHILPREDPDAAEVVQDRMTRDGVRFLFNTTVESVEPGPAGGRGEKRIRYTEGGETRDVTVDAILVSVGRAPNVENLGLEAAGVAFDRTGVTVDRYLHTTNPRIYAAGDICFPFKFTHTADAMAQIVIQNALFPHPFGLGRRTTDSLIIPWCTYTEPEIAHVGMYEADANAKDIAVETFTQPLADVDRAMLDGEDAGFARVLVERGSDRILGATIVATDAGNLISEVTVAMQARAGLSTIGAAIHPYPTQAEAWRKVANQLRRARFSPRQKAFLSRLFTWSR